VPGVLIVPGMSIVAGVFVRGVIFRMFRVARLGNWGVRVGTDRISGARMSGVLGVAAVHTKAPLRLDAPSRWN
jgi:hypothetical protein